MNKIQKAIASLVLVTGLSVGAAAQGTRVIVDNRELSFDQPPITREGRVLVPLRGIFEALGADVVWVPATRTVKATRGDIRVELPMGSATATVNGRSVYLDVPAQSVGGRTMVPLRFVSEALGADVDWRAATRTVAITSGGTVGDNPPVDDDDDDNQPAARLRINSVVHDASGQLGAGDRLNVVMTGDAGGRAFFDLMGVADNVPMREVRPGRYEGNVTIPNDVDENRATVVVRLINDSGIESMQEASRPVRFALDDDLPGGGTGIGAQLFPSPNSRLGTTRPTIQALFDQPVRTETIRLLLDGQDVTRSAQTDPRMVRYVPATDLYMGLHRARVEAVDYQGNFVNQEWTFSLEGTGTIGQQLTVYGLTQNQVVPRVFNVTGNTLPNALVRIMTTARRDIIPGFLGIDGEQREVRGYADASGNFNIQVDGNHAANGSLQMSIFAVDSLGRQTTPVELTVRPR